MKRLICEADVRAAAQKHEPLYVDDNTLVTAQAQDVAKELGVEICKGGCPETKAVAASCCSKPKGEPALTPEEIEKLTRLALERGIWTESDLAQMLKGLGRRS